MTREQFIPAGSIKILDKASDAIVYLFHAKAGHPAAVAFHGRRQRPTWSYRFTSSAVRERYVADFFDGRRRQVAAKAERRQRSQKPHGLQVGHILVSSWGYDQTNVSFYQVVRIVGKTMVELRQVARVSEATDWAAGTAVPDIDNFTSEPIRRRVSDRYVKISRHEHAHLWSGRPANWTAYA